MTKHRVNEAAELDDLMNRVREHWDEVEAQEARPTGDGFDARPAKLHGPAQRRLDLAAAYDFNLVASHFATVEAFGRKRRERPVVKSESAAGLQARLPPQTAFGQAGLAPPTQAGIKGVPQWMRQEMAYEEAIRLIEERARRAAQGVAAGGTPASKSGSQARAVPSGHAGPNVSGGAVPEGETTVGGNPSHVDTSDRQPDRFEPLGPSAEVTDPGFEYEPGQSFFESLAAGAQVQSGEGAEFIDPEATQTQVAFGRPVTRVTSPPGRR